MNYKELRAQATRGPLYATACHVQSAALDEDNYVCGCEGDTEEQENANAKLVVHCVNHFDEVMEALSELYDYAHKHTLMREFEGGAPVVLVKALSVLARARTVP